MDVLLNITGIARSDTEDVSESLVRGQYYKKDDDYDLFYDGVDDETPQLITHHRIIVREGKRVEVQRTGAIRTTMIIVPGELNQCNYSTPYGVLLLDFWGVSLSVEEREFGVRIEMEYEIRIDNLVVSHNTLILDATAVPEEMTEEA